MMKLPKILARPELPTSIPENGLWLSGEGAGSWFVIVEKQKNFEVTRYSPKGDVECTGEFMTNEPFDLNNVFTITYPSHCLLVSVLQEGKCIRLKRIKKN